MMDTRDGKWLEDEKLVAQLKEERPSDLEQFAYGQRVQIGTAHFEVTKIDTRKNRLVLKAVPRPLSESVPTETLEDRTKAIRDAFEK